jgi:hypothetical protein
MEKTLDDVIKDFHFTKNGTKITGLLSPGLIFPPVLDMAPIPIEIDLPNITIIPSKTRRSKHNILFN